MSRWALIPALLVALAASAAPSLARTEASGASGGKAYPVSFVLVPRSPLFTDCRTGTMAGASGSLETGYIAVASHDFASVTLHVSPAARVTVEVPGATEEEPASSSTLCGFMAPSPSSDGLAVTSYVLAYPVVATAAQVRSASFDRRLMSHLQATSVTAYAYQYTG
jgi:hypothetical protein